MSVCVTGEAKNVSLVVDISSLLLVYIFFSLSFLSCLFSHCSPGDAHRFHSSGLLRTPLRVFIFSPADVLQPCNTKTVSLFFNQLPMSKVLFLILTDSENPVVLIVVDTGHIGGNGYRLDFQQQENQRKIMELK